MRTKPRTRIAAAIAGLPALIVLAVLAACSSAGGTTTSNAPAGSTAAGSTAAGQGPRDADYENVQAITTCYRQHGDPGARDPIYDPSGGNWHLDAGYVPDSTQRACQYLFPATAPSPPVPQAEFQELLHYAQCMRQHGLPNWPDPNADGQFKVPQDVSNTSNAIVAHANSACSSFVPSGGLNVVDAG